MKINKQCLVLIHVLSCFIYLPGHCHCLHLILNYQFDIHITFRYFPLGRRNLKNGVFTLKKHQMFSFHTPLEEFKTQQSLVIQEGNFWLRKIRAWKPVIISTSLFSKSYGFKMVSVYTQSRRFLNSSGLKSLLLVRCDIESNTRWREIPCYGRPCIIYHLPYKTLGPRQWISWLFLINSQWNKLCKATADPLNPITNGSLVF